MVTYEELKDLYAEAACSVVGIVENCRISGQTSFMEALASQKPVIAAKTKALMSVYGDKDSGALFYDPGNSLDLAEKIKSIWNNKVLAKTIKIKEAAFLNQESVANSAAIYKTIKQLIQLISSQR